MPTAAVLENRLSKKLFSASPMIAAGTEPTTSQKNRRRQYRTSALLIALGAKSALTILTTSPMK